MTVTTACRMTTGQYPRRRHVSKKGVEIGVDEPAAGSQETDRKPVWPSRLPSFNIIKCQGNIDRINILANGDPPLGGTLVDDAGAGLDSGGETGLPVGLP